MLAHRTMHWNEIHHKWDYFNFFEPQNCFRSVRSFGSCAYTQGQYDSLKSMECPASSLHPVLESVQSQGTFQTGGLHLVGQYHKLVWFQTTLFKAYSGKQRLWRIRVQNVTFQIKGSPQQDCLEISARSYSWISRQPVTEGSGAGLSWRHARKCSGLHTSTTNGPFFRGDLFPRTNVH